MLSILLHPVCSLNHWDCFSFCPQNIHVVPLQTMFYIWNTLQTMFTGLPLYNTKPCFSNMHWSLRVLNTASSFWTTNSDLNVCLPLKMSMIYKLLTLQKFMEECATGLQKLTFLLVHFWGRQTDVQASHLDSRLSFCALHSHLQHVCSYHMYISRCKHLLTSGVTLISGSGSSHVTSSRDYHSITRMR